MAADLAAHHPRHPVLRLGARGRRPHRPPRPTTPWPTLAWLAVFFLIGVYAMRGVAWWPLGAVAAIAGVLVTGPVVDPARPEPSGSPLMRRLNLVVAGAIIVAGVALLPVWRPIDPGLDAPAGVVGNGTTRDHRGAARPRPSRATGCSTRSRGAPGSSSRCPTCRSPSTRGSSSSRRASGTPTRTSSRAAKAGQAQLDGWGVDDRRRRRSETTAMADRLAAAGWRSVYADADGSVLVAPER